jgi:hypothetical protein
MLAYRDVSTAPVVAPPAFDPLMDQLADGGQPANDSLHARTGESHAVLGDDGQETL